MATSLELAIAAIRSGRKEEGRQLLNLLIQQNPNNEMAWLWMSSVVNSGEQRARCLYHVLAINPDNELARRGLQLLGIVVSDSRPVKVPRDSQPIPIQKPPTEGSAPAPWAIPTVPTPGQTETQPLGQPPQPGHNPEPISTPTPAHQTGPLEERRPFRLDPRAITQELPFTPLREPFAEPARRSPSAFVPRVEADQPAGDTSQVAQSPTQAAVQNPANPQAMAAFQPGPQGSLPHPSEPGPAINSNPAMALIPAPQTAVPLPNFPEPQPPPTHPGNQPPTDTGPLPNPQHPFNPAVQANYSPAMPQPQQPFGTGMVPNETRPSQPIWATYSNEPMSLPQQAPSNQLPYPGPAGNSNVTMGMPTQYLQPQNPLQAAPDIHSNATMGMSLPPQNGQMPHPSEPVPVIQPNGPMGMASYAPYPFQQPYPQNQVFHSSSTMAMPTMTEAEARARLMASQQQMPQMPTNVDPYAALRVGANQPDLGDYRGSNVSRGPKSGKKKAKEEDEEEVNLLAVIVFGSLSVTALGGMGMLILLWFTSVS